MKSNNLNILAVPLFVAKQLGVGIIGLKNGACPIESGTKYDDRHTGLGDDCLEYGTSINFGVRERLSW